MLKKSQDMLTKQYQLALVDLDGVVYKGSRAIDHAVESLSKVASYGMSLAYTTNNSSRFPHIVSEQLCSFGLSTTDDQIITSSLVAARMVAQDIQPPARVLVIGAEHLKDQVARAGFEVVEQVQEHPQAVIQGWYPDLSWSELAQVSFAVESGAAYYVTNRDLTIPREYGIAPGCGAMIQAVIQATGVEPIASAGKPESAMYDQACLLYEQQHKQPIAKTACLAIGDRLDTDIEAANRGGYDSLLVLTGVTDIQQLLTATSVLRPTYIAEDLRGLYEQYAPIVVENKSLFAVYHCSQEYAYIENNKLYVSNPQSMDTIRAACQCVWDYVDTYNANIDSLDLCRLLPN